MDAGATPGVPSPEYANFLPEVAGDTHMTDTPEHRKFVYGFARDALKRNATTEQVEYALELLNPLTGHKALGFRTRLQAKRDGKPWSWGNF